MKTSTLFFQVTIILLSSFSLLSAQQEDLGSQQALMESSGGFYVTFNKKDMKAIGSPYLFEKFAPAHISAIPNEVFKVRYNAYDDEIEIQIDEDNIQNFNKNMKAVIVTMLNSDLKFTSVKYIDDDSGIKTGYLISHTESNTKVKLYSRTQIKHFQAKVAVTSYDIDKPAEFKKMSDTYFISINGAYARKLSTKKKNISNLFPQHSKDILNFIKKNKIKTSREADLINLINYINTL
ncbi:MAG: hypothetical protein ACJA1H_001413 [Glaciecola sp.]|jgi:hypothetical protein